METPSVPTTEEKTCCGCKDGCKCKKGKGLIITTIIMTVLALCGVGFGVYGMIKANEKPAKINPALSDNRGFDFVTDTNYAYVEGGELHYFGINLTVINGKVSKCELYRIDDDVDTITGFAECPIEGLEGEVYKVAEIYDPKMTDTAEPILAFILQDGTVSYTEPTSINPNDFVLKIQGKIKTDKPVTDILPLSMDGDGYKNSHALTNCNGDDCERVGNYLRLSDNTYVEFSENMLEKQ